MNQKSKFLVEGPVSTALYKMAMPMIFGIVAILSIMLIDAYFIGQLGVEELAAISFTFPVSLTVASLAVGLGAGASSVVARAIGAGDFERVKRLATDSLFLSIVLVIIVSIIGFLTIDPLFRLMGASDEIMVLIYDYMVIWYASMPFLVVPMVANAMIRATGDALIPSLIMVSIAVVNAILDPILIFGLYGFPRLEILGAAWAGFIGRFVSMILAMYVLIYREKLIEFTIHSWAVIKRSWSQVLAIAVPSAIGNAITPLAVAVVISFIASYGTETVAAFGVATRIETFAVIPLLALSAAIGPFAGQNWGAKKLERIKLGFYQGFSFSVIWATILAVVFWLWAEPLADLFTHDQVVIKEIALYLHIVPFSLFGYGMIITASAAFNALGRADTGLYIFIFRNLVLYIPLSWLAGLYFSSGIVYWAIAATNIISGVAVGIFALYWIDKKIRGAVEEG
ncbi:MAG: MATE family efflux transporter [Micavibrio sp.]|nr:MATE family efflux transporter [Micavibrio sp.]|tara:strand:- start:1720 stop:3081 length:1362 start_codon:yes stop_codon:yes gene_type:complete